VANTHYYARELGKRLLAAGADPNVQDSTGKTPLLYAFKSIKYYTEEMVSELLKAVADPKVRDASECHRSDILSRARIFPIVLRT
jgi:ankyrin repeat protein